MTKTIMLLKSLAWSMTNAITLHKVLQVVSCFMCFIIAAKHCDLVYMNYGGYLVGSLLDANESGCRLFLGATIVSFVFLRLAAIGGFAASLLCLPLDFYVMAPGTVQYLFPGPYWPRSRIYFIWNEWAFLGILLSVMTVFICCRSFVRERANPQSDVKETHPA